MYQLFKKASGKYYQLYAWVNPEGVCFTSRAIAPYGFVRVDSGFADGRAVQELKLNGYKQAKTNMTQEQLSKGWLLE